MGAESSSDDDGSDSELLSIILFLLPETVRAAAAGACWRLEAGGAARAGAEACDLESEADASEKEGCLTGVGGRDA